MNPPLPVLDWIRRYDRRWLRGDVVAGITLAAYLLPAGLGDASLANLPPQAGLYACLFGGLVFWLFCSSRHTAITVTSAISLLIGASLGDIAGGDTARFGALAAGTALLVALIAFIAWLVKAGADRQLHFRKRDGRVQMRRGAVPRQHAIAQAVWLSWRALAISGSEQRLFSEAPGRNQSRLPHHWRNSRWRCWCSGKFFSRTNPWRSSSWWAASWLPAVARRARGEAAGHGAAGTAAHRPARDSLGRTLNDLLPLAFACFLLGAVETAAIGRMFAAKHGGRLDANQEFLALAAANLAAGLGGGFPVSGGMSQSLVNEGGGARTPLSGAFAARNHFGGGAFLFASARRACLSRCWRRWCWWRWPACSRFPPSNISGAATGRNSSWPWRPLSACSGRACCAA